jgi:hypothetical protein
MYYKLFIENVKRENVLESLIDAFVRATEATVKMW